MKRYQYTCTLLSDVIISSVTAKEGFHESLDYIPGAKFLGIVAGQCYDEADPATLDLFHNGKVRFGDAYPCLSSEESGLPVPYSWYYEKGEKLNENSSVYLHHYLNNGDPARHDNPLRLQLEQARQGYFLPSGEYAVIEQEFTIRSKYNRKELRADDGKMFGYFLLPEGSVWSFIVEDDTGNYGDKIQKALVGKKRVGRSRSAEFGLVEISFQKEVSSYPIEVPPSALTLVYALSNLCFYDAFGRPTATPTAAQLGIPEGKIIWEKSQVRSRLYQTWNRKRHNRDADRIVITKGSVLAIRHEQPILTQVFEAGIGSHRSEGFGKVLVNPSFLLSDSEVLNFSLKKKSVQELYRMPKEGVNEIHRELPTDTILLKYIADRKKQKEEVIGIDEIVNKFVKEHGAKFEGISPSQWGTIRAYAKNAANWESLEKMLFDEKIGALHRGQSESDWRKNNRRGELCVFVKGSKVSDHVSLMLKLASEMAKRKSVK